MTFFINVKKTNNKSFFSIPYLIIQALILLIVSNHTFAKTITNTSLIFNEKIYGAATNIVALDNNNSLIKLTTEPYWRDVQQDISAAGDITFSSNRKDKHKTDLNKHYDEYNIFYKAANSRSLVQVSKSRYHDAAPVFDGQAKNIAFIRSKDKSQQELHIFSIQSKNTRVLFSAKRIFDIIWQENHVIASIQTDTKYQVVSIDTDGKVKSLLLSSNKNDKNSFIVTSMTWSPSQHKLAYIRHPLHVNQSRSLWTTNRGFTKHKQVSPKDIQVQNGLSWDTNGSSVIYSALVDYSFSYNEALKDRVYQGKMPIYRSDLQGNTKKLLNDDGLHLKPSLTHDGAGLVYLYSPKLGDATHYSVIKRDLKTQTETVLHQSVSRDSSLDWLIH